MVFIHHTMPRGVKQVLNADFCKDDAHKIADAVKRKASGGYKCKMRRAKGFHADSHFTPPY